MEFPQLPTKSGFYRLTFPSENMLHCQRPGCEYPQNSKRFFAYSNMQQPEQLAAVNKLSDPIECSELWNKFILLVSFFTEPDNTLSELLSYFLYSYVKFIAL